MERFAVRQDGNGWWISIEDPHCPGIVFSTIHCPRGASQHLRPADLEDEWLTPEAFEGEAMILTHETGMRVAIALAALQGKRTFTPANVQLLMLGAFRMVPEEVLYWFTKTFYGRQERIDAHRRAVREILKVA